MLYSDSVVLVINDLKQPLNRSRGIFIYYILGEFSMGFEVGRLNKALFFSALTHYASHNAFSRLQGITDTLRILCIDAVVVLLSMSHIPVSEGGPLG